MTLRTPSLVTRRYIRELRECKERALEANAEAFLENAVAALDVKEQLAQIVFEQLELNQQGVRLKYIDIRAGSDRDEPLFPASA